MMKRLFLCGLVAAATAVGAFAQPYGTDVFATVIGGGNSLVRIDSSGNWTSVATGLRTYGNMVCMANDNTNVVVGFPSSPPELVEVDPATGTIVSTIFSGAPLPYVDYFNPTGDGDYVVAANTAIYLVRGDGSGASTVASGTPFQNLQGICQDVFSAGYGAADITASALFFVDVNGNITQTSSLTGMNGFSLTQDHRDGTFYLGGGGSGRLYAVSQAGTIATVNASLQTNANAIGFDRWTGNGEIVVGSNPLLRVDSATGAVVQSHPNQAGTNTGLCFDRSRNVVAVDLGSNRHRIDVSIPSQANKGYLVGLTAAGPAPGIPIDSRVVPLTPDDVLVLATRGLLAPFLTNNIGSLDGNGTAFANLDLSRFGPLPGIRLWIAAITLDAAAPSGVGVITKPIVILLD